MWMQLVRSFAIFRLALSFVVDYWRIRWMQRWYEGERKQAAVARVYARSGARVRRAAFRLQGLFVKVGQFLSTRTDVLPLAFTRELTQLQDAVPGAPFQKILPLVQSELGADLTAVFANFDQEAIAAASLGQVHRAVLRDGQTVAVKLLRPGIERLATIDLSALRRIIGVMHRFTRFGKRINILSVYREFEAMVKRELDYRLEAENLRRFARQLASDPRLLVPRLHDSYVTRRMLVMEYIDGARITDVARFTEWGVQPKRIVEMLLDSYLRQILVDGFVHVDPHPGNLLVLPDGRVAFLDFGMMSEIPRNEVAAFARLVKSALARNLEGIVQAVDDLGFLQPHADREFLQRAFEFMLDRITGLRMNKGPELEAFIEEFQNFLHDEPLVLQAKYMFLGRAVGIISGVINSLDPALDWTSLLMDRALPLLSGSHGGQDSDSSRSAWREGLRSVVTAVFGPSGAAATDVILEQLLTTAQTLVRTPGAFERLLQKADRGELTIRLDVSEVLDRMDRQSRLITRVTWLILTALATMLGVWMTWHGGMQTAAWVTFGIAVTFGLLSLTNLVISRRRDRRSRRRSMSHRR